MRRVRRKAPANDAVARAAAEGASAVAERVAVLMTVDSIKPSVLITVCIPVRRMTSARLVVRMSA